MSFIMSLVKKLPVEVWIITGLLMALAGEVLNTQHLASKLEDAQYAALNRQAADDTTRLVLQTTSFDVWQKLVRQETKLKQDSIDKILKVKPVARAKVVAQIKTVVDTATAEQTDDAEGFDTMIFHSYKEPFDVESVLYFNDPLPATIINTIKVDPLALNMHIGCKDTTSGPKLASVWVDSPKWVTVKIDTVYQNKGVCNPETPHVDIHVGHTIKAIAEVGLLGILAGGIVGWFIHSKGK